MTESKLYTVQRKPISLLPISRTLGISHILFVSMSQSSPMKLQPYTWPLVKLRRDWLLGNRQLPDWTIFSRRTTRLAFHISLP